MSPQSPIARYRITARLGAGGMVEVYRASDTEIADAICEEIAHDGPQPHGHVRSRWQAAITGFQAVPSVPGAFSARG
jgi:hypothetical protein